MNTETWRCSGRFPEGDGGITYVTQYAKTRQEMLILRDKGYTCTPLHDEAAAVPVEALEGLVAKWQEMLNIEYHLCADELTQLIKGTKP